MIVAGIGYRSGATPDDLRAALSLLAPQPDAIATVAERAGEPLAALALAQQILLISLSAESLRGIETPTQSPRILARFGTGSLAEACAIKAAGPGATLIQPRVIAPSGRVTVALAQGTST